MFQRLAFLSVSVLLSGAVIGSACSEAINESGYAFDRPDHVYELPKSLAEISGLTLMDGNHLGAIDDESSKLFMIDIRSGEVSARHDMGSSRDYEAVERVGNRIYVLASNGRLFEITDWPNNKRISQRYKTGLDAEHDTEGLAYDAAGNRLLIACKEYPGMHLKGYKAIYAFDLERMKLLPEPAFKIDLKKAEEMVSGGKEKKKKKKSWWKGKKEIKPAALAIHPVTGQLFVISSTKRRIIVFDSDGSLAAVYKLPKEYFVQAEGMAFLPSGDLFISNERANRKSATLLRFNYRAP